MNKPPEHIAWAAEIAREAKIGQVHLVDLKASKDFRVSLDSSYKVKIEVNTAIIENEDPKVLGIMVECRVDINKENADTNPPLSISMSYLMECALQKEISTYQLEKVANFSSYIGTTVVWPYFRELTQSTMSRMGLKPVMIGLLQPSQIPPVSLGPEEKTRD